MAVLQKSRCAEKVPPGLVAFGHQIPPGQVATRRHGGISNFHLDGWLSVTKFHLGGWLPEGMAESAIFTRARVAHADARFCGPFSWNLAFNYK